MSTQTLPPPAAMALVIDNYDAIMREARGWLRDCSLPAVGNDHYIRGCVDHYYCGGWAEFLQDVAEIITDDES